jgi:hypothetical protein
MGGEKGITRTRKEIKATPPRKKTIRNRTKKNRK